MVQLLALRNTRTRSYFAHSQKNLNVGADVQYDSTAKRERPKEVFPSEIQVTTFFETSRSTVLVRDFVRSILLSRELESEAVD